MKKVINYFLQGTLYIAPFGVTVYFVYLAFSLIENLLRDTIQEYFNLYIPGLSLVLIFLFLVLIGIIGQTIIARPIKILFTRLLERAPLLKLIYSAVNDLFSAFVGKERKFNKPVIVQVNTVSNLEKLGFMTEEDLSEFQEKDKVAVYFPHSYNFSGELFIVPRDQVRPIDVNPATVMKFIVSGGVSDIHEGEK